MPTINEQMDLARREAHALLKHLGIGPEEKALQFLSEAYAKVKVEGALPREALGLPNELLELAYQYGYNLFQNGKYREALLLFGVLKQLDATDPRYTFAIAACHHRAKEYLDAAANYLIYKYMDPLNPIPDYHLYDCFMKAEYPESALYALQEALVLCERDSAHRELEAKIRLERDHLQALLSAKYGGE